MSNRIMLGIILFSVATLGLVNSPARGDCEANAPARVIEEIWANKKAWLTSYLYAGFRPAPPTVADPDRMYFVEVWTINLVRYAARTGNTRLLDELAELYLIPYQFLTPADEYAYAYHPQCWDAMDPDPYSIQPVGYPAPACMWLTDKFVPPHDTHPRCHYDGWDCACDDPEIPCFGHEPIHEVARFLHGVAVLINAVLDVPVEHRTPNMTTLVQCYAPIITTDHLYRWIAGQERFQVRGWHCANGLFDHKEFLQRKLNWEFGDLEDWSYCNAVNDHDMQIIGTVVEILAAHAKDPNLVYLYDDEILEFGSYAQFQWGEPPPVALVLPMTRLTSTTGLTDLEGSAADGLCFDLGVWREYPDYAYAGNEPPPYENCGEEPSSFWPPFPPQQALNIGEDLSHFRTVPEVLETLHKYRYITGSWFPDEFEMEGLANQFLYGVFNKRLGCPLFANFFDGSNGWYRVDLAAGSGQAPWDLSGSALTAGYGFLSKYNADMARVASSVWAIVDALYSHDQGPLGRDALPLGATWTSQGYQGGGLQFDGVDGFVDCGKYQGWRSSQGAIELWVKPDGLGDGDDLAFVADPASPWYDYLLVRKNADDKIVLLIHGGEAIRTLRTSTTPVNSTDWHHVAVTTSDSGARIFLDGVDATDDASGQDDGAWSDHVAAASLWLGKGNWNDCLLKGTLDEIRVYNRGLCADEVWDHYTGSYPGSNGLIAYWSCDDAPDSARLAHATEYYTWRGWSNFSRTAPDLDWSKTESLKLLMFLPSLVEIEEFFPDCNSNDEPDVADVGWGVSRDCNANGIPDECEPPLPDADGDGLGDACDQCPGLPGQILCDTFDTYADQDALEAVWSLSAGTNKPYFLDTAFGNLGNSIQMPSPPSSTGQQRYYRDLPSPVNGTDAEPLFFSYDVYLDPVGAATNWVNARHFCDFRGYAGGSYNNGAVQNVVMVGVNNFADAPGEDFDATEYQGRVAFSCATPCNGYYSLDQLVVVPRSAGWHRMAAEMTGSEVRFWIDGVHAETVARPNNCPFDSFLIGTGLTANGHTMWVDNVSVMRGRDCNDNGVPDVLDIAWGLSRDADADGRPDECSDCSVPADFDGDGDIDQDDFTVLADCLNGPGILPGPPPPTTASECLSAFDFDYDLDVDLQDFGGFQALFTGSF